jgi:hypothetical protein
MYHFVYVLFFHFLLRLVSSLSSLWPLPSVLLANVAMAYNNIAGTCYVLSCVVFLAYAVSSRQIKCQFPSLFLSIDASDFVVST